MVYKNITGCPRMGRKEGNKMKKYNDDLTIEIVAKELTDGLTEYEDIENFEEIITGLQFIMVDEGITLEQLREQCWQDSTIIFDKIYG